MKSIRTFLIFVLISTITLVSFLTALHGYNNSMKQATILFEDKLRQQANIIAGIMEKYGVDEFMSNYSDKVTISDYHQAFQVFSSNEELIYRSENVSTAPITELISGFSESNFSGYRWHVFVDEVQFGWIIIAERDDVRHKLAESIIMEAVFPSIISIPLTAILVWFVVTVGLRPIHSLASQLRSKEANDLTPLSLNNVPSELTRLAVSANDLLSRLERSFSREKRFNSDVAHELRTPIAALRIHLDNLLQEMETPSQSAIKLDQGMQRLSYLVEQIILLNRMTPDNYMAKFKDCDLYTITKSVIEDLFDDINLKHHEINVNGSHSIVFGDEFALEVLIKNIISNAVKYTPERGTIVINLLNESDFSVLEVMDNGPGIPENEYEHVFERFYRLGGDRHASSSKGCGLGLSIIRYIVELHHAELSLGKSDLEHGLKVKVSFPISHKPTGFNYDE